MWLLVWAVQYFFTAKNLNFVNNFLLQNLESEIQQNEMKLREVVEKGDQLLNADPQTPAVGNEVSMLQAGWEDLYRQAGVRRRHLNKAKVLQVCIFGLR